MKKTILLALMVVGLTVSFFVGITASKERGSIRVIAKARNERQAQQGVFNETLVSRLQREVRNRQKVNELRIQLAQIEFEEQGTQNTKSQRLRKELLQLFEKHIQQMPDEALIETITQLRRRLGEYEAHAKLQQIEKLLQEIQKTYPKSQAAEQARRMLEIQRGSLVGGDAETEPAAINRFIVPDSVLDEEAKK